MAGPATDVCPAVCPAASDSSPTSAAAAGAAVVVVVVIALEVFGGASLDAALDGVALELGDGDSDGDGDGDVTDSEGAVDGVGALLVAPSGASEEVGACASDGFWDEGAVEGPVLAGDPVGSSEGPSEGPVGDTGGVVAVITDGPVVSTSSLIHI
ncbi:hypothetical protein, partial [Mycolicibacterium palauense]|uniref:hypothetical protein n=1 Tax=Mycolicibacterium palauense TaxID=2034511 RepID=UPI00389939DA